MSGAELSYRIALRAFPKQYREERGEEIVATILEGGDGWRPRVREFFGLFWAGIAQRSLQAGGVRTAGSVRAGIRLGAYSLLWLAANDAAASLVHFHNYYHGHARFVGAAVTGFLVLLTLSRGWWAAPLTLVLVWELVAATYFANSPSRLWGLGSDSLAPWTAVFLPALLCLFARPRKQEPRDLRSPLWAIAAPVLGALMGWQWSALYTNPWAGSGYLALLLAWLVLGWRDLRLSVALATLFVYWGLRNALTLTAPYRGLQVGRFAVVELVFLLIAVVPIAIGFAGRRSRA
jgi:hypothetical protein